MCLAVTACGTPPAPREGRPAPSTDEPTHEEEANAIHLDEDVVRDLRLSTATVAERTGMQEVFLLGEVTANQDRYARVAPPTSGQVVRVLAALNAPVEPGTTLALVRSTDLGRSRAALLSATARRDLASQTLDRKKALAQDRIVAQREVQEAEAAFRAADAEARAAAAALSALGVSDDEPEGDSSLFFVRSPIAGHVIDRTAVLGQFAEPATPLFVVADTRTVWVVAQAFERDAVNVRVGDVGHVVLAALPGQEFDGRVVSVGGQVDPAARTVPVRIDLDNSAGLFRPGMSASVRLDLAGSNRTTLAVPSAALQRVGDRWLVFVPKGPSEYEMRTVGRGRDLGSDVEVVSGLRPGETIVVDGAFLLKGEAEKRSGGDEHGH
jgi:cobalt-zinc-cadmium efflux system membrane fusion protein